ncbi:hypothetical protein QL285_020527 [Trifolium repens]|nr:hypothetical protein QL285_020527 [Trifolium repens]
MLQFAYARCPPSHKGSTILSRFLLMFPSISYEYKVEVVRHNTQTHRSSSHDSTHETSVEHHSTVIQCHHGNYHQNYFIPIKLSSLLEDFPTLLLSINPRLNEYAEPPAYLQISFQSRLK